MKCYFVLEQNLEFKYIGYMEAEPVCGEDFCYRCGDCLECFGDFSCCYDEDDEKTEHIWIKYVTSFEEAEKIAKEYETKFIKS